MRPILLSLLALLALTAACSPGPLPPAATPARPTPPPSPSPAPSRAAQPPAGTPAPAPSAQPPVETPPLAPPGKAAEIVFLHGAVLTMEDDLGRAEALAVRDGMIQAVGADAEIARLIGAETRVIDLTGRALLPGFVDAHTHVFYFAGGDDGLTRAQDELLSSGITTIGEAGVTPALLARLQALDGQGALRVRTSLYLLATDNCGRLEGDWYRAHPPARPAGDMLHIPGIKIFEDGGACNEPALSVGGGDGTQTSGDLYFPAGELGQMIAAAQQDGYQVAVHAVGDRAVETALDAIAAALDGGPNVYRHRIEHNLVVRPEIMPRFEETGALPVLFGKLPACAAGEPITPPDYRAWEWPYRALVDANPGLPVAWHSDYPVFGSFDPVAHLYGMVTRKEIGADGRTCEPPDWALDDRLQAGEALRAMTLGGAYALLRDDEIGSLRPGKYADLVVLSADPLGVAPDGLDDLEVLLTMVAGRVEYCAPGYGDHRAPAPDPR